MQTKPLTVEDVLGYVKANPDEFLVTLKEFRIFNISVSSVGGIRFDRYHLRSRETIKLVQLGGYVEIFNKLSPRRRYAEYKGNGKPFVASYIAPLLLAASEWASATDTSDGEGQGYGLAAKERIAVEAHGMELAASYFRDRDWNVTIKGKPYDLLCEKSDVEPIFVEVKATTEKASAIIITQGEAMFATSGGKHVALVIVEDVILDFKGKTSGGKIRIFDPWKFEWANATPTHYRYTLEAARSPEGLLQSFDDGTQSVR